MRFFAFDGDRAAQISFLLQDDGWIGHSLQYACYSVAFLQPVPAVPDSVLSLSSQLWLRAHDWGSIWESSRARQTRDAEGWDRNLDAAKSPAHLWMKPLKNTDTKQVNSSGTVSCSMNIPAQPPQDSVKGPFVRRVTSSALMAHMEPLTHRHALRGRTSGPLLCAHAWFEHA